MNETPNPTADMRPTQTLPPQIKPQYKGVGGWLLLFYPSLGSAGQLGAPDRNRRCNSAHRRKYCLVITRSMHCSAISPAWQNSFASRMPTSNAARFPAEPLPMLWPACSRGPRSTNNSNRSKALDTPRDGSPRKLVGRVSSATIAKRLRRPGVSSSAGSAAYPRSARGNITLRSHCGVQCT